MTVYGCVYRASTTLNGFCLNCGRRREHEIHHAPAPIPAVAAAHPNVYAVTRVWDKTVFNPRWTLRDSSMLALSIILGGFSGLVILAFLMPAIWNR